MKSVLAALFFFLVTQNANAVEIKLPDEPSYLLEARRMANEMPPKLMAVLQEEIAKNGFASAISVCRDKAPEMAKVASEKSGWQIRRVSEKNRNPRAAPDEWELSVLQDFQTQAVTGVDLASLEKGAVVEEGGKHYYRYMKALPTNAMCLSCHGNAAQLHPDVKAVLLSLYPEDKATGYDINQIRGAITLKFLLPE